MTFRTATFLLAALAAGCKAPPLPRSTTGVETVHSGAPRTPLPLGPNDVLHLVVPQRPEFTSENGYRVTPAGSILVPIVGAVPVGGKTLEQAKETLEAALAEYVREPAVGLSVIEYGARRVYVLGEVARPGAVTLDRHLTALEVLALAEGLKEGANREHVALLRRHGPDEVEVHFFNAETPGRKAMVTVLPDDVLFVPRSGAGVFRDDTLPILQGIGFTTGQVAAVAVAADQL